MDVALEATHASLPGVRSGERTRNVGSLQPAPFAGTHLTPSAAPTGAPCTHCRCIRNTRTAARCTDRCSPHPPDRPNGAAAPRRPPRRPRCRHRAASSKTNIARLNGSSGSDIARTLPDHATSPTPNANAARAPDTMGDLCMAPANRCWTSLIHVNFGSNRPIDATAGGFFLGPVYPPPHRPPARWRCHRSVSRARSDHVGGEALGRRQRSPGRACAASDMRRPSAPSIAARLAFSLHWSDRCRASSACLRRTRLCAVAAIARVRHFWIGPPSTMPLICCVRAWLAGWTARNKFRSVQTGPLSAARETAHRMLRVAADYDKLAERAEAADSEPPDI
jgi:hypothetical protein